MNKTTSSHLSETKPKFSTINNYGQQIISEVGHLNNFGSKIPNVTNMTNHTSNFINININENIYRNTGENNIKDDRSSGEDSDLEFFV